MHSKLIFLDIDGTLTIPGQNTPPPSAQQAILQAKANGHFIFLCTGRNLGMLRPLLSSAFDGAVGSAGGYIFCHDTVLYNHPMSHTQRDAVLQVLEQEGVAYGLETLEGAYCTPESLRLIATDHAGDSSELARWQNGKEQGLLFSPIAEYDNSPVYKVIYACQNLSAIERAEAQLAQAFVPCRHHASKEHGIYFGELINRAFNKGTGIQCICDHLGRTLADTIGIGDSMNDLSMIQTVGTSVCMGNGVSELKQISDVICPPVEQDGLAHAFATLGLI